MDITYVGPHNAVEIETTPGVWVTVSHGDTVAVSDALAKGDAKNDLGGLLDQTDNWAEAKKPKPAPKTD